MLTAIGFRHVEEFNFVPTSGWLGDNIMENSPKMPWYKGPALVEAID